MSKSNSLCPEAKALVSWIEVQKKKKSDLTQGSLGRSLASFMPAKKTRGKFTKEDFEEVLRNFDFYKKTFSPIVPLPIEPILGELQRCALEGDRQSELYGDCLVQKSAILEIARPDRTALEQTRNQLQEWLRGRKPTDAGYSRHLKALNIINSVIESSLSS